MKFIEKLWGVLENEDRNFFAPESGIEESYENRYLIWLNGPSLKDQKNIVGFYDPPEAVKIGFRKNLFWNTVEERIKKRGSENEETDTKRSSTPEYKNIQGS